MDMESDREGGEAPGDPSSLPEVAGQRGVEDTIGIRHGREHAKTTTTFHCHRDQRAGNRQPSRLSLIPMHLWEGLGVDSPRTEPENTAHWQCETFARKLLTVTARDQAGRAPCRTACRPGPLSRRLERRKSMVRSTLCRIRCRIDHRNPEWFLIKYNLNLVYDRSSQ